MTMFEDVDEQCSRALRFAAVAACWAAMHEALQCAQAVTEAAAASLSAATGSLTRAFFEGCWSEMCASGASTRLPPAADGGTASPPRLLEFGDEGTEPARTNKKKRQHRQQQLLTFCVLFVLLRSDRSENCLRTWRPRPGSQMRSHGTSLLKKTTEKEDNHDACEWRPSLCRAAAALHVLLTFILGIIVLGLINGRIHASLELGRCPLQDFFAFRLREREWWRGSSL